MTRLFSQSGTGTKTNILKKEGNRYLKSNKIMENEIMYLRKELNTIEEERKGANSKQNFW